MFKHISTYFYFVNSGFCWELLFTRLQWGARNALAFFPNNNSSSHMLPLEPCILGWSHIHPKKTPNRVSSLHFGWQWTWYILCLALFWTSLGTFDH
jgi:hypothetical protein